MSDCINIVTFNKDKILLEMRFVGDDYETANVKFKLKDNYDLSLEEPVMIPVKCLFSMGYLMLMSIRRAALQYEKEVQDMADKIAMKKHSFKDIGA
jgi:hypothetical protein